MEQEKTQERGDAVTVYEVSYLLLPSLAVEQVPQEAAIVKEAIVSRGGEVLSGEEPVLIDLAYSMTKVVQTVRHKSITAYFGWIKFEMSSDGMEEIKKALDANNNILRYLIIKTVRENTLLNGKMKLAREEKFAREVMENDLEEVGGIEVVDEVVAEGEKVAEEVI